MAERKLSFRIYRNMYTNEICCLPELPNFHVIFQAYDYYKKSTPSLTLRQIRVVNVVIKIDLTRMDFHLWRI